MGGVSEVESFCFPHHHKKIKSEQSPRVVAKDFNEFFVIKEILRIKQSKYTDSS
jgi:hypothetical protein